MNAHIPTVISLVMAEITRQDEKWGDQHHHHPGTWSNILMEEVGEVAKAKLEEKFKTPIHSAGQMSDVEVELVQVAAVAIQEIACLIAKRRRSA